MRNFKFRVWFSKSRQMIYPPDCGVFNYPASEVKIMQFTGLKDLNGKECFEGDLVKFVFRVGDLAWEDMNEKEEKANQDYNNKEFVGEVRWDEHLCGFNLVVGSVTFFPAIYIGDGVVVGNIWEGAATEDIKL